MKNIRSSYIQYRKECKDLVDIKTYTLLAAKYVKFLMNKVVQGEEVTLPARMGTMRLVGLKQKPRLDKDGNITGLSPNWQKTNKFWNENPQAKLEKKIIFNTNEHSSGIRYKFIWSKKRVFVTNKTIYSLIMTRANKRAVYKEVMNGKEYLTCNK